MTDENVYRQRFYYIYKIIFLCGKPFGRYYYGKRTYFGFSIEKDNYTGSGLFCFAYFKKYGAIECKTYIKEIIEINPSQEINKIREEFWIGDKYKTDPLCMNLVAGGFGACNHNKLHSVQTRKRIAQYDLYGNLIKIWDGVRETARELNINRTGIIACLSGRKPTAFGYQWRIFDGSEEPIEPCFKIIPISQYTRSGELVAEYDSPCFAEKSTGINSSSIKEVCDGKRVSAGNYIWRYKKDRFDKYRTQLKSSHEARIYKKKLRPILQFTKDGTFIKEYKNISDAMDALGKSGSTSMIYSVANGKSQRKSAYGYKWRFKDLI